MIISPIKYEDINEMVEIENTNFKDPWDYKILYQETQVNSNSTYLGMYEDEYLVAYVGYWNMVDYFDIANIAVRHGYQRLGIASQLLDEVLIRAQEALVNNIFLEVSVNNYPAIKLYEKHGYVIVRTIKNYYTALKEDAFLMQKEVHND